MSPLNKNNPEPTSHIGVSTAAAVPFAIRNCRLIPRANQLTWLLFVLISALLHASALRYPHNNEGDEVVYQTLSQQMNWDLSHYTTKDSAVTRFPHPLYREPLFVHPPLLPFVLKVGQAVWGSPVVPGLVFQFLSMTLLLYAARRFAQLFDLNAKSEFVLYALLTCCPILLFSTRRLHHDGLLGIYLFSGAVFFQDALERNSRRAAWAASTMLAVAFNTRVNAVTALPLVLAMPIYHAYRCSRQGSMIQWRWQNWKILVIVFGLLCSVGLQHYWRLIFTYGIDLPAIVLMAPDPGYQRFSYFMQTLDRPLSLKLFVFLCSYPFIIGWCRPSWWLTNMQWLRAGSWRAFHVLGGTFLFATTVLLISPLQLRYLALAMPFLLASLALQVDEATEEPVRRFTTLAFAVTTIALSLSSSIAGIQKPSVAGVLWSLQFLLDWRNIWALRV